MLVKTNSRFAEAHRDMLNQLHLRKEFFTGKRLVVQLLCLHLAARKYKVNVDSAPL